ncbi:helix-turn-helix domain-containing protein [Lactobacillus ultunensis]|uniref:helix-turn-helix domain-containing protein n=1 Tax=Lactobacillus ultunensis TaxID=227945 RepID=UPI001914B478|nr:Rgg/GadR/MutR family transcriptional regulator [Lactobacillus ultunensis]QQP29474.1 helix-turn-helix domain-containing protein [Lactobacillus ultunensis]
MNKRIGKALKKIRTIKGLTQFQFAHNVVSESFYSKVERGKNEITASDLLRLLKVNHISRADFLAEVDSREDNDLQEDLKIQLLSAYSSRDRKKLEELNQKIQNSDYGSDIKTSSLLINVVVNDKVKDLSKKEKNQIKSRFFEVDDWTQDLTTLQLLCNTMIIFDMDELELFMKKLDYTYEGKLNKYSLDIQRIVASICINYFHNCYVYAEYEKAKVAFKIIDQLAKIPDLAIYIIVVNFYKAFFKGDKKQYEEITNFLDKNGLSEISLRLP